MRIRLAKNQIQYYVEVKDAKGNWKIERVFYSEEDAKQYMMER